jgi:hypothetical protein
MLLKEVNVISEKEKVKVFCFSLGEKPDINFPMNACCKITKVAEFTLDKARYNIG